MTLLTLEGKRRGREREAGGKVSLHPHGKGQRKTKSVQVEV